MTLTPRHRQTLAMFEEFGWHKAPIEAATTLPVGSWSQRETGKRGLTSGSFEVFDRKYHTMLTLFAIRVGVPATRLRNLGIVEQSEIMADVILTRGEEFTQRFVDLSCRRSMRKLDDDLSKFGGVVLWLVLRGDVPMPRNEDYFNDWAVAASRILLHSETELPAERYLPGTELIEASLREHVLEAVPSGIKISGPFRDLIDHAYFTGIISRSEAIQLGITGMLGAKKFQYRQDWVDFLVSTCQISPAEILDNYDSIKTAATVDYSRVLTDLVIPIIPLLTEAQLLDLVPVALDGASREAASDMYRALLMHVIPQPDLIAALSPMLHLHASRRNNMAGQVAITVIEKWKVPKQETTAETTDKGDLWKPAPPLWTMPRFDVGKLSLENLETQLKFIAARETEINDLEAERALALLTKVANSKTKGAQRLAKTVPESMWDSLLYQWADNEFIPWGAPLYDDDLFVQRRNAVLANLGQIPCLLSEPTYDDFTITVSNFISRLKKYAANNRAVLQPDLLMTLFRLDLKGNLANAAKQIHELNVDILSIGYTQLDATVGEVFEAFVADPLVDPGLKERFSKGRTGAVTIWDPVPVKLPDSLTNITGLVPGKLTLMPSIQLFPNFGDSRARRLVWVKEKTSEELRSYVPLLANHAKPLTPAVAINMMAMLRPTVKGEAPEFKEAVKLAWSRGLLQPGVADIHYLDWHSSVLGTSRLMAATRELAEEGLLALMWDIWVQHLEYSVNSTRLLASTETIAANLRDFAQYVPEEEGIKAVPAVRALATRRGQSEAIYAARKALEFLPKVKGRPQTKLLTDEDFAKIWPADLDNQQPAEEDHTTVTCRWGNKVANQRILEVSLELPEWSGVLVSPVINVDEGACYGVLTYKDFDNEDSTFYARVYWDGRQLIGAPASDPNNPSPNVSMIRIPRKVLSTSLVAAAIGTTATAHHPEDTRWILTALVKSNQISIEAAKVAMRKLLQSPDFSPARAAYVIENDVTHLPYLWPIITEGIKFAAQQSSYPRWVSKLLTITHHYRREIAKALDLNRMPYEEWDGVLAIANSDNPDIAVRKAQQLVRALGL